MARSRLPRFGGTGPPGERAAINFAKVGAGKATIDFLAELGDVWLHAAGIVEDDTKITAADLDAADVSFFDFPVLCKSLFGIEAQGFEELIACGNDFGKEGCHRAFGVPLEGRFKSLNGNSAVESGLDFCDDFFIGFDRRFQLADAAFIRSCAVQLFVASFLILRDFGERFF